MLVSLPTVPAAGQGGGVCAQSLPQNFTLLAAAAASAPAGVSACSFCLLDKVVQFAAMNPLLMLSPVLLPVLLPLLLRACLPAVPAPGQGGAVCGHGPV